MIKAIETEYNGYRFRSRLEARWAVFFDALGIEYEYEKEGYDLGELGWYLPDFWLPRLEMFIEIKGKEPNFEEKEKIYKLSNESGFDAYILTELPNETEIRTKIETEAKKMNLNRFLLSKGKPYKFNENVCFGVDIRCPICGFEYVHFSEPILKRGKDNYEAWEGRGDSIEIPMYCENGHSWKLRFGFHKGQTFYDFVDIEGTVEVDTDISEKFTKIKEKIKIASKTAKSARFEHGETPFSKTRKVNNKTSSVRKAQNQLNEYQEYIKPKNMSIDEWNVQIENIFMQGSEWLVFGEEIHRLLKETPDEYIEGLKEILEINQDLKNALDEYETYVLFERAVDKDDERDRKHGLFDF